MPRPVSPHAALAAWSASVLLSASPVSAAIIFWTGSATGNFQNPNMWQGGVPGEGDIAIFSPPQTPHDDVTVNFLNSVTNEGLAVGSMSLTLQLAGHTYTLTDAVTLLNANLTIKGGELAANVATINSGLLTVDDDALFTTNTAVFGIGAADVAQIDVAGEWNNAASIVLGSAGSGELNIGHDGDASTGTGGAVATGSLLLGTGPGAQGTINIGENATLESGSATLGVGSGSSATVNVGDGGAWTNTGAITAGALAGTTGSGVINVEDGGLLRTQNLILGSNGSVTQTGTGAVIIGDTTVNISSLNQIVQNRISDGGLFVGGSGLTVLNGGVLEATAGHIDGFTSEAAAAATVTGQNSLIDLNGGELIVGAVHNGSLTINIGGRVESGEGTIGENAGSSGTVTVAGHRDGVASRWNLSGPLTVGDQGAGQLNITGGGRVVATGDGAIGASKGSSGSVLVTGRIDPLDQTSGASTLEIGGNLTVGHGTTGGAVSQKAVNATLVFSNGGRIIVGGGVGSLTVNNSGLLEGSGRIDGSVQLFGRASPGAPGERMTISGDLLTNAGGILQIQYSDEPVDLAAVFPNLNPTLVNDLLTSGLIAVEGQAMLADGTVAQVVKIAGNATPGDEIIIIHAQAGGMDPASPPDLDVAGSFLVTWAPDVIEDNGQQYLRLIAQVNEPELEDFLAGLTGNVGNVADALAEGGLFDLLTMLDPNDPEPGLRTLLPLQHASAALHNFRTAQFFHSTFQLEMAALRSSIRSGNPGQSDSPRLFSAAVSDREAIARAVSAIDSAGEPISLGIMGTNELVGSWGGFIGGLGNWDRVDSGTDRTGHRATTWGVQGGVHNHLTRDLLLGISAGYLWSDLDFHDNFGEADIDTLRVGPYLSFTPGGGNFFIDAAGSWGWHRNEVERQTMAGTARSSYDAYDISAFGHAGYDFPVFERTVLTPSIGVDYSHLRTGSFRERGAGNANLRVDSMTNDSLRVRLGATLAHALEFNGTTIVPEVFAGWSYEFLDNDIDLRSSFAAGGPAFTTRAKGVGRDSILLSGGFTAMAGTAMTLFVRYEGEFQSDRTSHAVIGGLDIRF